MTQSIAVPGLVHRCATEAAAHACRRAQAHDLLGRGGAGVVKRLAAKLALKGQHTYKDRHGYQIEADLTDYIELAGFFGAHSPRLLRTVVGLLSLGDWTIDVGANVGLVTTEMCAAVGPEGSVWAIEPLPRNVDRLTTLKDINGLSQLAVFSGALSSSRATAMLRTPLTPGGSAYGSFVADWQSTSVEVPTCRLDDLIDEHPQNHELRLIKIDAEGAEPQVLAGAERTLRDRRPLVICEFNDILLRLAGTTSEGLLLAFRKLGYQPRMPLGRPRRSLDGRCIDILLASQ